MTDIPADEPQEMPPAEEPTGVPEGEQPIQPETVSPSYAPLA